MSAKECDIKSIHMFIVLMPESNECPNSLTIWISESLGIGKDGVHLPYILI